MSTLYVSYTSGVDSIGSADGSASRPFRSLGFAAARVVSGDEIVLSGGTNSLFSEQDTVTLSGLSNVTIRGISASVIMPSNVDTTGAILHITGCSNIRLERLFFGSIDNSPLYEHAILIDHSNNVTVDSCETVPGYVIKGSSTVSVFSAVDSPNTKFVSCKSSDSTNGNLTDYTFIRIVGDGPYKIYSGVLNNIYSADGHVVGIDIQCANGFVEIDGFSMTHRTEPKDIADRVIGVRVNGLDGAPTVIVNACQLTNMDIAVKLENIRRNWSAPVKIKRSIFNECQTGVRATRSSAELFNLTLSAEKIKRYEDSGIATYVITYGIFAEEMSSIHLFNSILDNMSYALLAQTAARINAEFCVWHNCREFSKAIGSGVVDPIQLVRSGNPSFFDPANGNFNLKDTSICLDSGMFNGEPYLGMAPDIGAMERSKDISLDELPAFLHRIKRFSTYAPLTTIDIEGMILRGLETADAEVTAAREGSAIRDITVKSLRTMLEPFTTELDFIRQRLSFNNLASLTNDDADMLASNVFVYRRDGAKSSGVVRIYFYEPRDISFPGEFPFQASGGQIFYSRQETTISQLEMQLNYENGGYYMDVIVDAADAGESYNIVANAITGSSLPLPQGVMALTNPYSFTNGASKETNLELHRRAKQAITVRDLVTVKGIKSVLTEQFPNLVDITPIGFRDPEMKRDKILGYSVGGHSDIYIKTRKLEYDSVDLTFVDAVGTPVSSLELTRQTLGKYPILFISSIEIIDTDDLPTGYMLAENEYSISIKDPNTRFSIQENLTLNVIPTYAGYTLRVNFVWCPDVGIIQNWINDSDNRIVCADLLVKHKVPCVVDTGITYSAPEEITGLTELLKDHISRLADGEPLMASALLQLAHSVGATWVGMPILLTSRLHGLDGTIEEIVNNDYLQCSRTVGFIPGNINVNFIKKL